LRALNKYFIGLYEEVDKEMRMIEEESEGEEEEFKIIESVIKGKFMPKLGSTNNRQMRIES